MTPIQAEFFRALCAPFPQRALFSKTSGGRTLTYLRAPTIMNRLDDVCGPDGWDVEYRETDRGYTCKIGILAPYGERADSKTWLYKEDGGGFEGMTKKAGGENIEDTDNDEKSAYTNAFRRAAMAWGIGRYLYGCGVANYLGDEPEIPHVEPEAPPPRRQSAPAQAEEGGRQAPAGSGRPAPGGRPAPRGNQQGGDQKYDNFQVPKSAKSSYRWAKTLEEHYGVDGIVNFMNGFIKQRGYKGKIVELDEVETADVCWETIEWIKSPKFKGGYNGEFDHVEMPEILNDPQ